MYLAKGELEITDAIQALLDFGHAIDSKVIEGWWKDTGKPEDILAANRLVLKGRPGGLHGTVGDDASVKGHVDLHESATIESCAVVRGPVSIASGTTITDGTYVSPYTSIGPDSRTEGVHIENNVVAGASTVGTGGKIVDSLLGRRTTIDDTTDMLPEGRRLVVDENSQLKGNYAHQHPRHSGL